MGYDSHTIIFTKNIYNENVQFCAFTIFIRLYNYNCYLPPGPFYHPPAPKETVYPLVVIFHSLLPHSWKTLIYFLSLFGVTSPKCFIQMESYNIWSSVSDFSHLALFSRCIYWSKYLLYSFLWQNNIPLYGYTTFVYSFISWIYHISLSIHGQLGCFPLWGYE